MSATGLPQFDDTLQKANVWLKEIMLECGWEDRRTAYRALRATLHALRDRLPVEGSAHLAAQLPLILRGVYYEGWAGHAAPHKARSKEEFLSPVADAFSDSEDEDPEMIAQGVFRVLAAHVSEGEIDHVLHAFPKPIREIFAETGAASASVKTDL